MNGFAGAMCNAPLGQTFKKVGVHEVHWAAKFKNGQKPSAKVKKERRFGLGLG